MGSHSVTCYLTQVSTPRLNPSQTGRYRNHHLYSLSPTNGGMATKTRNIFSGATVRNEIQWQMWSKCTYVVSVTTTDNKTGCPALSQSRNETLFEFDGIENLRFTVEIIKNNCRVSTLGFKVWVTIFGRCQNHRPLSVSLPWSILPVSVSATGVCKNTCTIV